MEAMFSVIAFPLFFIIGTVFIMVLKAVTAPPSKKETYSLPPKPQAKPQGSANSLQKLGEPYVPKNKNSATNTASDVKDPLATNYYKAELRVPGFGPVYRYEKDIKSGLMTIRLKKEGKKVFIGMVQITEKNAFYEMPLVKDGQHDPDLLNDLVDLVKELELEDQVSIPLVQRTITHLDKYNKVAHLIEPRGSQDYTILTQKQYEEKIGAEQRAKEEEEIPYDVFKEGYTSVEDILGK